MAAFRFPWWRFLAGLLLVAALLVTMVPLAVQALTVNWLQRQGLQAQFGFLAIAPLHGRISVHDIAGRDAAGDGFSLERLELDIAWRPLLRRQLTVEHLSLQGLHLDVAVAAGGFTVAGVTVAATAGGQPAAAAQTAGRDAAAAGDDWRVRLQHLSLENISACYRDERRRTAPLHLCAGLQSAAIAGNMTAGAAALQLERLRLNGLRLDDQPGARRLLQIAGVESRRLELHDGQISLADLTIDGIAAAVRQPDEPLAQDYPFHLRCRRLQLAGISHRPAGAATAVESIAFSDPDLLLHIAGSGELPLLAQISGFDGGENRAGQNTNTAAAGGGNRVAIGQLAVTAGRLTLIDQSPPTPVGKSLSDIKLTLAGLDSAAANRASPLRLSAKLDEFGRFTAGGSVKPLAEAVALTLQGEVKTLDLLPFSGYLEKVLGYRIVSGQLSDKFSISIADNQIDALSEVTLSKFDIESLGDAGAGDAGAADSGLLPIASALHLLRESDGSIALKLPVTGDLDDPDFSLAHITGIILRKALTEAVINYYTPFGLVGIGSALLSSATRLRFEPLSYPPGEARVTAAVASRLQQLSPLLLKKPGLNLVFCPLATGQDRARLFGDSAAAAADEQQQQRLRQLAAERGRAIKRFLVERQGVGPDQVVLCNPVFEPDMSAPPQVSISL